MRLCSWKANAGSDIESSFQSHPIALTWGVPAIALQNQGRSFLGTISCRMNEVLSPSSLCNPLALPHHGLHSPPLLTFSWHHIPDHKTWDTSSSSALCPLRENTICFWNFPFRPSCFLFKTSLWYYPQLISYFPQDHRSIHLSSFYGV